MSQVTATKLDLEFIRKQFPAFSEPSLQGQAFFENAGGAYACKQVIERLTNYYKKTKVQPYYPYPASTKAGEMMDSSYQSFAEYLSVKPEEVMFGPSTTQNAYVLAQAMEDYLKADDEIIVTNQDHEANGGAWRRLAKRGVVVKEWRVNRETGGLETAGLEALLSDKTKLVTFPHCSNIVGEINPVAKWTKLAHETGAAVVTDGVSYAGHGFPDMQELGCDIYLFSLYKTYGPHQGAMIVREQFVPNLTNQSHYFNDGEVHKRLVPAGPDHAQVAAAGGVTDYFDAVYEHHFENASRQNKGQKVHELLRSAEQERLEPLLKFLDEHPRVCVIGPADAQKRAPTVSILVDGMSSPDLVNALVPHGIMSGYGHFYAARLLEALGIDSEDGVARFSFVHYTSEEDVAQLIEGLKKVLD